MTAFDLFNFYFICFLASVPVVLIIGFLFKK